MNAPGGLKRPLSPTTAADEVEVAEIDTIASTATTVADDNTIDRTNSGADGHVDGSGGCGTSDTEGGGTRHPWRQR